MGQEKFGNVQVYFSPGCMDASITPKKGEMIRALMISVKPSAYSFSKLSQKLSNFFQLVLIDQPGHGNSTAFNREEDYLFSNLATWYEKVFESILDKPFYILGHSWRADVALHYAKHYREKIQGVILLDGAYTFPNGMNP